MKLDNCGKMYNWTFISVVTNYLYMAGIGGLGAVSDGAIVE